MKLPIVFLFTGAAGLVSLATNAGMYTFCIAASLFFTCIGIGGVKKYLSHDIYREKDLLQKEKISILAEKLIEAEKQIILLSGAAQQAKNSNTANC